MRGFTDTCAVLDMGLAAMFHVSVELPGTEHMAHGGTAAAVHYCAYSSITLGLDFRV